jgi:phosphatidylglycerophosphate synthase
MFGDMVVTLARAADPAENGYQASGPPVAGTGLLLRFGALVIVNLGLLAALVAALTDTLAGAALALVLYLGVNAVLVRGLLHAYPHPRLGLCNIVTHFRATLTAGLAAVVPGAALLVGDPLLAWGVVGIATIALACDGVDGWAARRSGLASRFGARFDMEVDSVLALILALIVWQAGKVGDWVILLGTMRYLFVLAMWVLPWLDRPTPPRFSGKLVCVIQIAVLIALVSPVVTGVWAVLLAAGALGLVLWSFAVDIRYLWQTRPA